MNNLPNNCDHSAVVRNSQGYKKLSKNEIQAINMQSTIIQNIQVLCLHSTSALLLFPVPNPPSVRVHANKEKYLW